jgi:hypothetical protein
MRKRWRRWAWWLVAAGLGLVWYAGTAEEQPTQAAAGQPAGATQLAAIAPALAASGTPATFVPYSAAGLQARQEQRALWQQRLERAQNALDAYRQSTRYPYDSQPIGEHPDQAYPNQPISEEHALRGSDNKASGLRLRTTQERVFVQGSESVRFTVSLVDEAGHAVPMRVMRASAREVPPPNTASLYPEVPMNFNDEGAAGDVVASDGIYSAVLQPATQGFAGLLGQIRIEVFLQYRESQGSTYFDILFTPDPPATWQGGVREALEDGSLSFYLKANVREPGRYVVSGRVDDASGKPFALLSFNEEVEAGPQEFRLTLFGKLVRDGKPAFPLTLRDVNAFLLRPDAFPDRLLMPRLPGTVATSRSYPLASFADAEWSSEERDRYLAELNRDLGEAKKRVDELRGPR